MRRLAIPGKIIAIPVKAELYKGTPDACFTQQLIDTNRYY